MQVSVPPWKIGCRWVGILGHLSVLEVRFA